MFRKADGSPFYDVDQKYVDIIDRESDLTLQYRCAAKCTR